MKSQTNNNNLTLEEINKILAPLNEENLKIVKDFLHSLINNLNGENFASSLYIYSKEGTARICPKCKSANIKKNGKRNGKQRYKCKDCNHVFSLNSSISFKNTKLNFHTRYQFIEYTLEDLTLRNISNLLGISIPTAHLMRHKLFETVKFFQDTVILSGSIYADELMFSRNAKDGRPLTYRPFRKHGSEIKRIEQRRIDLVTVMMAFDDNGHCLLKKIKTGKNKSAQMDKFFKKRVKINATLFTDGQKHYETIAEFINAIHVVDKGNYEISDDHQKINDFSSPVKFFIEKKHKGVATTYLQKYLDWYSFRYFIQNQANANSKKAIIKVLSYFLSSKIILTRKEIYKYHLV